MTEPPASDAVCASCGHRATGRFCSNCGAALSSTNCRSCHATLSPAASYCHSCGVPVGAACPDDFGIRARSTTITSLPWIAGTIALVALIAFVAGEAFNRERNSAPDASRNSLSQAGDGPSPDGAVRAPDISQLSPEERADRLYNRVILLDSQGKSDSVAFFAPMAIESYRMLSPINIDQRYDMGRIAEIAGALPLAKAQSDTILQQNPNHLLGLVLALRIATLENRSADAALYRSKLRSAYSDEAAKKLPEYQRHDDDIQAALARPAGTSVR